MLRSTLALCLVICGCGADGRAQHRSATARRSPACPREPARAFELPGYALDQRAFADWMGDDIVIVSVGADTPAARGQPAAFRGAIYDTSDARWIEIPAPTLPEGATLAYHVLVAGEHLALLWYATSSRELPSSGGVVFDRARSAWSPIPAAGAPPSSAFFTAPYRAAIAGHRWVFWPTAIDRAPDPSPYVLDVRAPRWTRGTAQGAPQTPAVFHRVVVRGDRVLVPDLGRDVAGVFDPARDRWERTPFVRLEADYVATVGAPGGDAVAVSSWSPAGAGMRLEAWIADVGARSVRAIPSPQVILGATPNTRHVYYDGESLVYVDATRAHRFSRGRWTGARLPLDGPVTSGGFVRAACGGQLLLQHDRYWLLDVARMAWHPVRWPAGAPINGHRMLFAADRIAVLGDVHEEVEPAPRCPVGAPCVPPERRRVRDPRAFLIPLR